jgi:hypothetical protein
LGGREWLRDRQILAVRSATAWGETGNMNNTEFQLWLLVFTLRMDDLIPKFAGTYVPMMDRPPYLSTQSWAKRTRRPTREDT